MSFAYTEKHKEFREQSERFIRENIAPYMLQWDKEGIDKSLFKKVGNMKINGILVPEEKGGLGLDFSYSTIFAREIVKVGDLSTLSSIMIQANTVCTLLTRYGNDYIEKEFLRPIINGDLVSGIAVSEPTGGSDLVSSTKCFAEEAEDCWILNGEKMYITNSPIADVLIVFCRTLQGKTPLSMSFLAVPTDLEGVEIEDIKKLGQTGSQIGKITFANCRVPKENMVGKKNHGYLYLSEVFQEERLLVGAASVTMARRCIDLTTEYVKSKHYDVDKVLFEHQVIRYDLAYMDAEISACESFIDDVITDMLKNGKVDKVKVCMAKYAVVEKAQEIVRRCADFYGKNGLYVGNSMERLMRDIIVLNVYAGTAETMRELAAKSIKKIYG